MKKIIALFILLFTCFVFDLTVLACPSCEDSTALSYHWRTLSNGDPFLNYSTSLMFDSVSAPIYDIHVVCNGTNYLLFLSSGSFSGKSVQCWGNGDDAIGSSMTRVFSNVRYRLFGLKNDSDSMFQYNFNGWYSYPGSYFPNNYLEIDSVSESAILAIDTSDMVPRVLADGSINVPIPFDPASDMHDFSKDIYDPNLSVPVLSNVSYTGFFIDNPDGKELQVVVDGRVFGLKWNPSYTDPMLLTNFNYTVNHQIWNFADHPDTLNLNGRFDVFDNFGISTYDWFVEQVRQYANDVHPSDYPNYSFLKVGIKTGWNTFLDYIKDIGSDEAENPDGSGHRFEQNIYRSRMCQVTYYVRFVEYDADGSPHYSRWMAYTLKPSQDVLVEGENFSRGNVEFGEVSDVDPVTGRPVVSDKESLKYNTSTGEYEYYDPLSNQNFQFEMDDVFGYLSGLKESVMGFADLIAYCFSFLPSWVSQFISYSLVVAISFSVIRLIRG